MRSSFRRLEVLPRKADTRGQMHAPVGAERTGVGMRIQLAENFA